VFDRDVRQPSTGQKVTVVACLAGLCGLGASLPVSAVTKSTSTTVAPSSTSVKTSAKSAAPKKAVNPGTPFKGWGTRSATDWPSAQSALVLQPLDRAIIVRQSARTTAEPVKFTAGGSVSGKLGLLAIGEEGGFWKVLIPVRPNETVGWVAKETVKTAVVTDRVVVDLSSNTLYLYRAGNLVSKETVATGTGGTPTPSGLFFIKSVVKQANPNGGRGPYVLVLSGYSEVLTSFGGGAGAIGIHGTSAPGKLGQNVSHGCIRINNQTITTFAQTLPPGTPVEVLRSLSDAPKQRWATPEPTTSAQRTPTSTTPGSNAEPGLGTDTEKPPVTGLT
jgi:lipoprotein-anchoring transpeptidase ErfK/SrfK